MSDPEIYRLRKAGDEDRDGWLEMRGRLFPDCPRVQLARELEEVLDGGEHSWGLAQVGLVAEAEDGRLVAFVEVNLRRFAAGCESSPVGYLEAWYVEPEWRRRGVGGRLVEAAEQWARRQGCTEMASDCDLENETSERAHRALGYGEVNRIIQFARRLDG